jgi:Protein of unknown function (DUF1559)
MGQDTPDETVPKIISGHGWVNVAVVLGILLVLAALIVPAVQQARQAARRTASRINLLQLGLAFHNYHDVYAKFPLGAAVTTEGVARHGWLTRMMPYVESSRLYSSIEQRLPWDALQNKFSFSTAWAVVLRPGVEPVFTADGYGLTHYLGNPNVLHRNSCVSLDEMTSGTSNNWLVGEVAGNYQPWGYPFNWRALTWPLNGNVSSYGAWPDGCHICLADGSVKFFSDKTDRAVIESLATAPPIASAAQTATPETKFSYQH